MSGSINICSPILSLLFIKMKSIFCHNEYHLGDCIQTLHFLIKCSEINDIKFNFFCNQSYFSQLKPLLNNHVELVNSRNKDSIETWIGDYNNKYKEYQSQSKLENGTFDQGNMFLLHWQFVSKIMNLNCPFKEKKDLIYDEDILSQPCVHNQKYDYLIINSKPLSGQCSCYSESKFINLVEDIQKNQKTFITTEKIKNYPCTKDYNLNVAEIGQLSKNVKNIFAVNTGPLHLCMNKWSIENNFILLVCGGGDETFHYGSNFRTIKQMIEKIPC